jgi:hypothetical protein
MIPSFVPVHAIASMILSMCTLYTLAEYVYDDACDESMCGQEIGLSSDCVHITNISCVGDDIFSTGNGKVWECWVILGSLFGLHTAYAVFLCQGGRRDGRSPLRVLLRSCHICHFLHVACSNNACDDSKWSWETGLSGDCVETVYTLQMLAEWEMASLWWCIWWKYVLLRNWIEWGWCAANSGWCTSDSIPANGGPAESLSDLQSDFDWCLNHGVLFIYTTCQNLNYIVVSAICVYHKPRRSSSSCIKNVSEACFHGGMDLVCNFWGLEYLLLCSKLILYPQGQFKLRPVFW